MLLNVFLYFFGSFSALFVSLFCLLVCSFLLCVWQTTKIRKCLEKLHKKLFSIFLLLQMKTEKCKRNKNFLYTYIKKQMILLLLLWLLLLLLLLFLFLSFFVYFVNNKNKSLPLYFDTPLCFHWLKPTRNFSTLLLFFLLMLFIEFMWFYRFFSKFLK